MPNVKPGDLAQVTDQAYPTEWRGAHVLVEREHVAQNANERRVMGMELWWECAALQYVRAPTTYGVDGVKLGAVDPGMIANIPDKWLRRIDPPADTESVYSEQPIEGEEPHERIEREPERTA